MIKNEHTKKETNGYFERTFKWNVKEITKGSHKAGYIVQKISRRTIASDEFWRLHQNKDPFIHTYYSEYVFYALYCIRTDI